MKKMTTCLWFASEGEEAAKFYCSIFKDSKITNIARYEAEGAKMSGQPEGSVMTVAFELDGNQFLALNGGPVFKFSEAISIIVECDTQEEIDHYWSKLTDGGKEIQCGWLQDKYGLAWQITPRVLMEITTGPDRARAGRAMKAMGALKKLDIAKLVAA